MSAIVPVSRAMRAPSGATRSAVITAVTSSIARAFMSPATSRIAIGAAQLNAHPTPSRHPSRHPVTTLVETSAGADEWRQRTNNWAFHREHCSAPAQSTITPAPNEEKDRGGRDDTALIAKSKRPASAHRAAYPIANNTVRSPARGTRIPRSSP